MKAFSAANRKISEFSKYLLASKKRTLLGGVIIYTAVFLLFFIFSVLPPIMETGTFLGSDGIAQYYPFLLDFRSNTIDFIESVKSGNPQLTMMNFDYFYGSDTISTTTLIFIPFLPYYFCSAFIPETAVPMFFAVGVIILSYFSGLSFMYLCSYYKRNMLWAGFLASFYVFCGNYFFTGALNSHFLYMYIAFPLMIVGMDRILTNKGCGLFVLATCWVSIPGLPFIVYTIPFVVVFAIIRVYFLYKGHFWKNLGKYFLRGGLLTILALLMSGMSLLIFFSTYFTGMRSSQELSVDIGSMLIPSFDYLEETLGGDITGAAAGISIALLPCLIYLFTSYRTKKELKVMNLVSLGLIAFPVIRYGLNVFQYELCRWGFVPAALFCFSIVSGMPALMKATKTERGMYIFVISVYTLGFVVKCEEFALIFLFAMAIVNAVPYLRKKFIRLVLKAVSALKSAYKNRGIGFTAVCGVLLFALIIGIILIAAYKHYSSDLLMPVTAVIAVIVICVAAKKNLRAFTSVMLAVSITVIGIITSTESLWLCCYIQPNLLMDDIAELERKENTFGRTAYFLNDCAIVTLDRSGGLFNEEEMKEYHEQLAQRTLIYDDDPYLNRSLRSDVADTEVFMSNVNGDYVRFLNRCGMDAQSLFSQVDMSGFSGKEAVYSLFGVTMGFSPVYTDLFYGMSPEETILPGNNSHIYLYNNKYALPAGVTYDNIAGEKEFISYNSAELPYAMLDSIYLEGYETNEYSGKTYSEKCSIDLRQELRGETSYGMVCYDNYVTIEDDFSDCFLYISFDGVEYSSYEAQDSEILTINAGDKDFNFCIHNSNSGWPWKYYTDHYCLTLGYHEDMPEEIFFISPFNFETVSIYAVPAELYRNSYENRTAEILENVEMSTNTLTGDLTVSSDKVLSVNMLYSRGWTAYIDGEQAPVYKANGLFLGIPVTEGTHTVKLVFRSPWLYEGLALSAAATAVFVIIMIVQKKKTKKS